MDGMRSISEDEDRVVGEVGEMKHEEECEGGEQRGLGASPYMHLASSLSSQ